jgi:hypothetical protein
MHAGDAGVKGLTLGRALQQQSARPDGADAACAMLAAMGGRSRTFSRSTATRWDCLGGLVMEESEAAELESRGLVVGTHQRHASRRPSHSERASPEQ